MKLTKAQVKALRVLGRGRIEIVSWGGKLMTSLPGGIRSRATLDALTDRGLVDCRHGAMREEWTITPAGLSALAEQEKAGWR